MPLEFSSKMKRRSWNPLPQKKQHLQIQKTTQRKWFHVDDKDTTSDRTRANGLQLG